MKSMVFFLLSLTLFSSLLKAAEPIRLVTGNYPPYEYEEAGEIKGLVVDVLKEAFARSNQSVEFKVVPWARALWMAQHGEADAVFATIKTPERKQVLNFSNESLIPLSSAFFVKKGSPIQYNGDLNTLAEQNIGLLRQGSHGIAFDTAVQNGTLKYPDFTTDTLTNIKKLVAGRIDMMAGDRIGTLHLLQQNKLLDQVNVLAPEINTSASYLAFSKSKDHTATRDAIDKAIRSMKKDGSYQRIVDKYTR
ncbi:transporter substrate-binding domain-containing protein [Deefgea tanakiae]|uniref:Transporter substrate-binding domain-containing protein n=1 Tax=Deefgea tanakiae TaxID=2865840 RepID=A0ABX8Z3G3_9NEIS|nr:transporter substrate-binding domain-containing protein [Deefgea tanakiae]QZA77121.1 transporter substrate-binding domain-containing protein [Deefgea tanakiae]